MELTDFTYEHMDQAMNLAKLNYEEEREKVPILPVVDSLPSMDEFTLNGLGVSAWEDGKMIGFLCCYGPMDNFFGKTLGAYSPIHAHGAVKANRSKIYSYMYQFAAEKWVRRGILSHAITLYAHDTEAINSFFWNGFGMRCVDAIRSLDTIEYGCTAGCIFYELPRNEAAAILGLKNELISHLNASPMFVPFFAFTREKLEQTVLSRDSRIFAAYKENELIAYLEVMKNGENYACDDASMMNICGAFMRNEYRGSDLYTQLLAYTVEKLKAEGYTRLGVDFESFNPAARGFWLKHFTPYTYSVTRRIDERICNDITIQHG